MMFKHNHGNRSGARHRAEDRMGQRARDTLAAHYVVEVFDEGEAYGDIWCVDVEGLEYLEQGVIAGFYDEIQVLEEHDPQHIERVNQ